MRIKAVTIGSRPAVRIQSTPVESGAALLHVAWPGQINTSGNLAFPYSPSDIDTGAVYEFTVYHLMAAETPTELFPVHYDDV